LNTWKQRLWRKCEAFRPEFLNRIDETVGLPCSEKPISERSSTSSYCGCSKRLEERHITLELGDSAKKHCCHGYDPAYGARPLKEGDSKGTGNATQQALLAGKIGWQSVIAEYDDEPG